VHHEFKFVAVVCAPLADTCLLNFRGLLSPRRRAQPDSLVNVGIRELSCAVVRWCII